MPAGSKTKVCSDCGRRKRLTSFYVDLRRNQPRPACKDCYRAKRRARYSPSEESAYRVALKYGVSPEEYDRMCAGGCMICGGSCGTGKRLAVDHDHETGAVRGVLCAACNLGLGKFKDNPWLLRRAIEYLGRRRG